MRTAQIVKLIISIWIAITFWYICTSFIEYVQVGTLKFLGHGLLLFAILGILLNVSAWVDSIINSNK